MFFLPLRKSTQLISTSANCLFVTDSKCTLLSLQEHPYFFTYKNSNYLSFPVTSHTEVLSQVQKALVYHICEYVCLAGGAKAGIGEP